MQALFDANAPESHQAERHEDLLAKARALDINLSATLEQALAETLRRTRRAQWLAENRTAIDAYNAHVEEHGVFSDGARGF